MLSHLAKLSHSVGRYSDNNDQHLTNLINMAKNIGAAIHETHVLKFKKKFHLKHIKVLIFETNGPPTLHSLAYASEHK